MSQVTDNIASIPAVATSYVCDSGTAVPAANILNVVTGDGLTTTGSGNTITITEDGVDDCSGTTVGAVTADICTVDAGATPGTYALEVHVAAFDSATPSGAGYRAVNGVRTTGAATTLTGSTDRTVNEEAALVAANVDIIASGNNFIVRVTGVAGLTVNWVGRLRWVFAS